jgi:hypothetical protein
MAKTEVGPIFDKFSRVGSPILRDGWRDPRPHKMSSFDGLDFV